MAARPRERAIEAERGAGSAAAVPRSGAALIKEMGELGKAAHTDRHTVPTEHHTAATRPMHISLASCLASI
jgi:hypothetical protein